MMSRGLTIVEVFIGGSEVKKHAWPWAVALTSTEFGGTGQFCGGTLIDEYHVLTAAHCFPKLGK